MPRFIIAQIHPSGTTRLFVCANDVAQHLTLSFDFGVNNQPDLSDDCGDFDAISAYGSPINLEKIPRSIRLHEDFEDFTNPHFVGNPVRFFELLNKP